MQNPIRSHASLALLTGVSAAALLCAAPALAQDANASSPSTAPAPQTATPPTPQPPAQNDASGSPDIIVTAQFRKERLQDTPLAITARAHSSEGDTSTSSVGLW